MQKIMIVILLIIIISGGLVYRYNIKSVSKISNEVEFEVTSSDSLLNLGDRLLEQNLIRSVSFYKLYIKVFNKSDLQAGLYILDQNMSLEEIINTLASNSLNANIDSITIIEGSAITDIIEVITSNTSITKEQILEKLNDEVYLNELIEDYWFLTDDILNEDLFYSLEGYLYPDTYEIDNTWLIEDIFKVLLDEFDKKTVSYKDDFLNSEYNIHEIITLSSIVERESSSDKYNALVAGLFYNRLDQNMSLGSDVTTYYDIQVNLYERDLYASEIAGNNGYNTRSSSMVGQLPIGPICSPSIKIIEAVLNPEDSDYLYFVSDKDGIIYFNETYSKHQTTIAELKSEDKWFEYKS